jgi:hypothetical protein
MYGMVSAKIGLSFTSCACKIIYCFVFMNVSESLKKLIKPYWSSVELNWTAVSVVSGPVPISSQHILQWFMLFFPKLLLSSWCF